MKQRKIPFVALLLSFLVSGMTGCSDDPVRMKEEPDLPDIPIVGDTNVIYDFREMEIKDIQQIMQGKWEVYEEYGGGFNWQPREVTGYYDEYIGTDRLIHSGKGFSREYNIVKWERSYRPHTKSEGENIPLIPVGCKIYLTDKDGSEVSGYILSRVVNDTLHYSTANESLQHLGWSAKRVK